MFPGKNSSASFFNASICCHACSTDKSSDGMRLVIVFFGKFVRFTVHFCSNFNPWGFAVLCTFTCLALLSDWNNSESEMILGLKWYQNKKLNVLLRVKQDKDGNSKKTSCVSWSCWTHSCQPALHSLSARSPSDCSHNTQRHRSSIVCR